MRDGRAAQLRLRANHGPHGWPRRGDILRRLAFRGPADQTPARRQATTRRPGGLRRRRPRGAAPSDGRDGPHGGARGPSDALGAGERYQRHLRKQGRKRATLAAVESAFRVWLDPQLGDGRSTRSRPEDVEDLMRTMKRQRWREVGPQLHRDALGIVPLRDAPRRRWATTNPCEAIDLPPRDQRRRSSI